MGIIYNISLYVYLFITYIFSLFNKKAKQWLSGRKKLLKKIKIEIGNEKNIVWFHAASLGEFEQGRPVINNYKSKYPNHKILLTFYSPSGYNIRKNYSGVDWVYYLPIDTKYNAKEFIKIVKPIKAVFIKYEFWFNYMNEMKLKKIPLYFISCIFRKDQYFFKYKWFGKQLQCVSHFFVQDETSKSLLLTLGLENVTVSGDTRFDQVKLNTKNCPIFPVLDKLPKKKTIVFGSTWKKDENIILAYIKKNNEYNYIIAPHEIENCNKLIKKTNGILLSKANEKNIDNILIIDSIGNLPYIYKYADMSYIGGGFGSGVHNVLEPVVFGSQVLFGPNFLKSNEAKQLISINLAKSISTEGDLCEAIELMINNQQKKECISYIQKYSGATKVICDLI